MDNPSPDLAARIKAVLPARWFGESTPNLDALLNGLAAGWTVIHEMIGFLQAQTRLATASGMWLDLLAEDYFGYRLTRKSGMSDSTLRANIRRDLLAPAATRAALSGRLESICGSAPEIFEPLNPSDTGGYVTQDGRFGGGVGYGAAGGWGSLAYPFQVFVTVQRPNTNSISRVGGWSAAPSGYGLGATSYAEATNRDFVSDADIRDCLQRAAPAGTIIWLRITG